MVQGVCCSQLDQFVRYNSDNVFQRKHTIDLSVKMRLTNKTFIRLGPRLNVINLHCALPVSSSTTQHPQQHQQHRHSSGRIFFNTSANYKSSLFIYRNSKHPPTKTNLCNINCTVTERRGMHAYICPEMSVFF